MTDREQKLNDAEALLRKLEGQIQDYVDANPDKQLDQLEKERPFRILSRQAANTERIIRQLKSR